MAANLTTTYASQILDLLGLSKFKGGIAPPAPPPPDKNIPVQERSHTQSGADPGFVE